MVSNDLPMIATTLTDQQKDFLHINEFDEYNEKESWPKDINLNIRDYYKDILDFKDFFYLIQEHV